MTKNKRPLIPVDLILKDLHKPTTPFAQMKLQGNGRSVEMIRGMSDDQVRYALWSALTLGFGDPVSNLPELMITSMPMMPRVAEAHLILAQIGFPSTHPGELARIKKRTMQTLAEE